MNRDDFMDIVYSELESDPDNNRANRIIWAADGYAERRVDDALQVIEEQQSVQLGTDLISRLAAIDAINEWLKMAKYPLNKSKYNQGEIDAYDTAIVTIKSLPPAQSEQRTGEYVHVSGYSDQYKCTACGIDIVPMRVVKFCPECGTKILKMISGERIIYPWEGDAE